MDDKRNWNNAANSSVMEFIMDGQFSGWAAFGMGSSNMYYADIFLLFKKKSYVVQDSQTTNLGQVFDDLQLADGMSDITLESSFSRNRRIMASFTRPLNTGDPNDYIIRPGIIPCICAYSTDDTYVQAHGPLQRHSFQINFFRDEPGMPDYSHYPDSYYPSIKHRSKTFIIIHQIIMSLVFLVLKII